MALIGTAQRELLDELRGVYGRADGQIDLSAFFDLLAVHELAHLFHSQVPARFPRLWLMELFVNLCLHAYVATVEPDQIPALETFPQVLSALSPDRFPYHTLVDFEARSERMDPQNYGWYQAQWHVAAQRIYAAGGNAALQRLWQTFVLSDRRLAEVLRQDVHPEVARVLTAWPG